jgi:hypothetical protein
MNGACSRLNVAERVGKEKKKNVLDGLMMMMDSNETWHFIFIFFSLFFQRVIKGPFVKEQVYKSYHL